MYSTRLLKNYCVPSRISHTAVLWYNSTAALSRTCGSPRICFTVSSYRLCSPACCVNVRFLYALDLAGCNATWPPNQGDPNLRPIGYKNRMFEGAIDNSFSACVTPCYAYDSSGVYSFAYIFSSNDQETSAEHNFHCASKRLFWSSFTIPPACC